MLRGAVGAMRVVRKERLFANVIFVRNRRGRMMKSEMTISSLDNFVAASDSDLLRRFAEERREEAFATVVRRHVNWVY
jgi:hypothetical protein